MKKRVLTILAAVLAAAVFVSCSIPSGGTQAAGTGTEAASGEQAESGETPETDVKEPQRVVAGSRSLAELWLLAGGELLGITEDAADLPGIGEQAEVIGTISKPNREAILALEPDLVLLSGEMAAQKELLLELEKADISCMPVEINSFADYSATMEILTGLTGREDLFQENVTRVRENMDAVLKSAEDIVTENRTKEETFLTMRVSATKNKTLKQDYFACEIFSDFGLSNIAEDDSALDELNLEAVVSADPDYIFVIPQGEEDEAQSSYQKAFTEHAVWSELEAVKNGHVFVLPKDLFQYKPNARWDEAYEYIFTLLQK